MKTFLLLLSIVLAPALLSAQSSSGYADGFVVTNEGDTIKGQIKHRSGDEIKDRIYLKISEEEKRNYKTTEIRYFQVGNESFISHEIEGEKVFLMEWQTGYLELYEEQIAYSQGGQDAFTYQPYIRRAGEQELVPVKVGGWKKQILGYISDYEELAGEVDKNKYKLEQLGDIVKKYNEWKDGNN